MALSMGRGRMSMLDYIREQEDFGPGGAAEPAVEFGNFFQGNPTYYGTAPGAAAQPGPQGQAVDQYAAIRNLQPIQIPRFRAIAEDEWLRDNYGAAMPPTGAVQIADNEGNLSWAMPAASDVTLDIMSGAAGTPFQSKYNTVVGGPDGSLAATFQRPGMHKHDTFQVLYRQGPDGRWTMDESTIQAQRERSGARKMWDTLGEAALVLGAGYLGGTALSGVAAGGGAGAAGGAAGGGSTGGGLAGGSGGVSGSGLSLSGATSNAGIGAGTTTGFGGTGAGLSIPAAVPGTATSLGTTGLGITGTTGAGLMGATPAGNSTLQSPLTNSPQFQPSPNLPTGAVDPVTMPALPSSPTINPMPGGLSMQEAALGTLPEVAQQQSDIPATDTPAPVTAPSVPGSVPGPGPGLNSPLPSWMPQWLRDNPQLARQVITGMGGLLGAMEGNSGGSAPAAPSYGPAQQWTSGLSMAAQPRPRQQQPALNYNQPAPTGLAMGAGRFLRGG